MLEFDWKIRNWSERWNLSAKCQVDQNVEIWVKRGDWSKCPNLSERGYQWKQWNLKTEFRVNQNAEIWLLMIKLIKMLKLEWKDNNQSKCWNCECKCGNRSKCWNLCIKGEIDL